MEQGKTLATDRWLTEQEVAVITRISRSTLQKQRFYRRGIPYSKIGASVRYSFEAVKEYMHQHEIQFNH